MAKKSESNPWKQGTVGVQKELTFLQSKLTFLSGSDYPGLSSGYYKLIIYKVFAKIEVPAGASKVRAKSAFEGYTLPLGTKRGHTTHSTTENGKTYVEMYYYVRYVDFDLGGKSINRYFPSNNYQPFQWTYYLADSIPPPPF